MHKLTRHLLALTCALAAALVLAQPRPAFAETKTHIVQGGEYLTKIAQSYGVQINDILKANNLKSDKIFVGQTLIIPIGTGANIPGTRTHIVKRGDTLSKIGRTYGLPWNTIAKHNGLATPSIYTGQVLLIPASAAQAVVLPLPGATPGPPAPVTPPETALTLDLQGSRPHQDIINAVYVAASEFSEDMDDWIQSAGLAYIYGDRRAGYMGPVLGTLPQLTVERQNAIIRTLDLPTFELGGAAFRASRHRPSDISGGKAPLVPWNVQADKKWILIDLSDQMLYNFVDKTKVRQTKVSTGRASFPTIQGTFSIYVKFEKQDMKGEDYDLKDVPWTMFFYAGYGLHGTYWHNDFGTPHSHGCVNMPTPEAEWTYSWAPLGTPVVVQK